MIQSILIAVIVAAAAAWLLRGWWRKATSKTACGCDHCPMEKVAKVAKAPIPSSTQL